MTRNLSLWVAIATALLLLAGLNWWQYGHGQNLGRERDQAQQAAQVAQAQTQALQQRFNAYVANADQMAADLRAALAQQATTAAQLQKVYQDDTQAKDWADQPVPAGISRLLQPQAAAD